MRALRRFVLLVVVLLNAAPAAQAQPAHVSMTADTVAVADTTAVPPAPPKRPRVAAPT